MVGGSNPLAPTSVFWQVSRLSGHCVSRLATCQSAHSKLVSTRSESNDHSTEWDAVQRGNCQFDRCEAVCNSRTNCFYQFSEVVALSSIDSIGRTASSVTRCFLPGRLANIEDAELALDVRRYAAAHKRYYATMLPLTRDVPSEPPRRRSASAPTAGWLRSTPWSRGVRTIKFGDVKTDAVVYGLLALRPRTGNQRGTSLPINLQGVHHGFQISDLF